MQPYRLRLTLDSPLGTPLTGDTLFGHLCWGIVYHQGREALEAFLEEMASGSPPLVIGDPAPAGMLPLPVVPPHDADEQRRMETLAGEGKDTFAAHDRLKRFRKLTWVTEGVLARCIDELTAANLLAAWLEADQPTPAVLTNAPVAHNSINRFSQHTAEEGGLFFQEESFPPGPVRYDLHLRASLDPDRIRTLFQQGLEFGYGRDASTGKGCLRVGPLEKASLPAAEAPNAALALGAFAPADDDPATGWWRSEVRLGKVSGAWAFDAGGQHPPFKFPLTLLRAGSLLAPHRRPFLGRVVSGVHPTRTEVVTVAMTPVLPVRCPHLPACTGTAATEVQRA